MAVLGIISDNTENRVFVPDTFEELYYKTQNSVLTACTYLVELGKAMDSGDEEIKKKLYSQIYSLKMLFFKIHGNLIKEEDILEEYLSKTQSEEADKKAIV